MGDTIITSTAARISILHELFKKGLLDPQNHELQKHIHMSMGGIGNPFIFPNADDDWDLGDDDDEYKQPRECEHAWIWYHGFAKSFEFCEKCDKKKEDT